MKMLIASLIVAIGLISACGNDNAEGDNTTKSLSYNFEYNGCKTEKHTFDSETAYCEGLQSHSLNKGCAQKLRELDFQAKKCPGTFTSKS